MSAVIDSSSTVVASYRYDAFGNLISDPAASTLDQPFRFSTKRYDADTGLYYYGYRYYSPLMGKWITRDPIGENGGINLYGFVGNSPMNSLDPYGLEEERPFTREDLLLLYNLYLEHFGTVAIKACIGLSQLANWFYAGENMNEDVKAGYNAETYWKDVADGRNPGRSNGNGEKIDEDLRLRYKALENFGTAIGIK